MVTLDNWLLPGANENQIYHLYLRLLAIIIIIIIIILWDMPIQTNCEIRANRPDIVIKNKQEKSYLLINMSIPTEKNTSVKVIGNRSKYKDLEVEIERMRGMKAITIPVVIGALGLIKKGLEEYIQQIPGNIKIHEQQKITLFGTSRILRKALSMK